MSDSRGSRKTGGDRPRRRHRQMRPVSRMTPRIKECLCFSALIRLVKLDIYHARRQLVCRELISIPSAVREPLCHPLISSTFPVQYSRGWILGDELDLIIAAYTYWRACLYITLSLVNKSTSTDGETTGD